MSYYRFRVFIICLSVLFALAKGKRKRLRNTPSDTFSKVVDTYASVLRGTMSYFDIKRLNRLLNDVVPIRTKSGRQAIVAKGNGYCTVSFVLPLDSKGKAILQESEPLEVAYVNHDKLTSERTPFDIVSEEILHRMETISRWAQFMGAVAAKSVEDELPVLASIILATPTIKSDPALLEIPVPRTVVEVEQTPRRITDPALRSALLSSVQSIKKSSQLMSPPPPVATTTEKEEKPAAGAPRALPFDPALLSLAKQSLNKRTMSEPPNLRANLSGPRGGSKHVLPSNLLESLNRGLSELRPSDAVLSPIQQKMLKSSVKSQSSAAPAPPITMRSELMSALQQRRQQLSTPSGARAVVPAADSAQKNLAPALEQVQSHPGSAETPAVSIKKHFGRKKARDSIFTELNSDSDENDGYEPTSRPARRPVDPIPVPFSADLLTEEVEVALPPFVSPRSKRRSRKYKDSISRDLSLSEAVKEALKGREQSLKLDVPGDSVAGVEAQTENVIQPHEMDHYRNTKFMTPMKPNPHAEAIKSIGTTWALSKRTNVNLDDAVGPHFL